MVCKRICSRLLVSCIYELNSNNHFRDSVCIPQSLFDVYCPSRNSAKIPLEQQLLHRKLDPEDKGQSILASCSCWDWAGLGKGTTDMFECEAHVEVCDIVCGSRW